ncbi:hypothetical protein ACFLS8_05880 [Chloroflexota bacterium]
MNDSVVIILVLVVTLILTFFVIPQWRIRRAMRQVIGVFREYGATQPSGAKTLEELGLVKQTSFAMSLFRRRDYKRPAVDLLIRIGALQEVEEGRLYLVEEELLRAKL